MSADPLRFAAVVPIAAPTIAFGAATRLKAIYRREPGYLDNPARQSLRRTRHAHAAVLVTLVADLLCLVLDTSCGSRPGLPKRGTENRLGGSVVRLSHPRGVAAV